jgi:dTMP kinase
MINSINLKIKKNMKPLFIVIEGIDGCGKTTQIELLKTKFKSQSMKVIDTAEPTDGPIGSLVRNIMKGRIQTDQSTIAALFAADRLDHINNPVNGMLKKMDEGYNIICSRYYFSNYAFQSEYVPIEWLVSMNSLSKNYIQADHTFYINVDPEVSIERISKGRSEIEMYENIEKLTKTHESFLKHFNEQGEGENIHLIDGHQGIEDIGDEIWSILNL